MREPFDDRTLRMSSTTLRRPLYVLLSLIVLTIALLVLDRQGLLRPVRHEADALLSPALQALVGLRTQAEQLGREVGDAARLRQENQQLRDEVARLRTELIKAEPLLLENGRLRRQLQIEDSTPWQLLGAEVSAFSPDAGRRTLSIARGSNDGVKPGMAVVGQEGSSPPALVGVVEQVEPESATVLLITDYGSALSTQIYHEQGIFEGLLRGQWQRGSRLQMEQVPADAHLAEGDVVLTAGLTGRIGARLQLASIPPGVPVGTVVRVQNADNTQTAEVLPFVDPDQVRYIWIIFSHGD